VFLGRRPGPGAGAVGARRTSSGRAGCYCARSLAQAVSSLECGTSIACPWSRAAARASFSSSAPWVLLHLNSIGAVAHGPSRLERDPGPGLRSTGLPELCNFTPSASTKMSACIATDQGPRLLLLLIALI
jgi:hypothetical protein